jgi:outer membrane receptor protein involved in Fe transport
VNRRLLTEKTTTVFVEPALFAEAAWQPLPALTVVGGVRADYESVMHAAWVDRRVTVRFNPIDALTLKAAAGLYHQPPDYTQGLLSPAFGNPALKPEEARQYLVGAEARLTDADSVDVQLYYKDLRTQTRQVLVSGLGSDVNIPGAATRFSSTGYGRAYGADLLLRHKLTKNLFGWVAYSLSRYERDYYGGVAFAPGPLDQPHNLIVVASYTLPWNLTVGAKFRWSSGPLVTPIVASLYDSSGNYYYPLPGLPWSQRLPDFLQFDVRVDKRFVFQSWSLVVFLDVQNVTNRGNPEGLFYNSDYTQSAYVTGIPILPALGARGEW